MIFQQITEKVGKGGKQRTSTTSATLRAEARGKKECTKEKKIRQMPSGSRMNRNSSSNLMPDTKK